MHVCLSSRVVTATLVLSLALAVAASLLGAPPAAAANDPAGEVTLVNLIDRDRGAHDRPTYRVCADLRDVARRWSTKMATDGRLSHDSNLGQDVRGWRSLGDNVGYDHSVEAVHDRFMASADHRPKVLSTTYTEVGVGVEQRGDRVWVTEVFREPDGSAPCEEVPLDERITTACPPGRVPPGSFADVRGNAHREAIDCAVWYGLARGTDGQRYSPSTHLDRAQMAALLARLADYGERRLPPPRDQGFRDINGNPHADAINQLAAVGVVRGTTPDTYSPNTLVTRGQMATLLVRVHAFISGEQLNAGHDWFHDDDGSVHEANINRAAEAHFVAGVSVTSYAPQQSVRRDQIATFAARVLNRLVSRGHMPSR